MSVKIDDITGMRVRFPARTWGLAHDVIEDLKERPPEGYRMVESHIQPRSQNKSGRRCNVKLTFDYVDDRVPRLTVSEACDFFEPFSLQAQGVEPCS